MAFQIMFQPSNNRVSIRKDRVFRDRSHPLDIYDDAELIRRYRMPRHCILDLIDTLSTDLEPPTMRSHSIPASLQIFAALRYYATGSFQQVIGDISGLSQPSVSRIIQKTSKILSQRANDCIKFPTTPAAQLAVKQGFSSEFNMPNTLGCVDGTLIAIKPPTEREDAYVCRKGYHAINVQGVCDNRKILTNIIVQWPGSTHDAYIWGNSRLREWLEGQPYIGHLLGDQAYPLKQYLMTPLRNPHTQADRAFNAAHKKARQRIEDTFGRWKSRWMCIHKYGSPFIIEIDELTSPKVFGDGLKQGVVGQPASFKVDSRGFPGELKITVEGPHYPINCTRTPEKDGTINVTFVPEEFGTHKIRVSIDGRPLDKSPYIVKVVDPGKIRISGGWRPLLDDNERIPLVVGKEKQIPFDASAAGPGELTADVRGPTTKIPTAVETRPGGRHTLVFTPEEEGDHYINVKWDGFPLPNTPYKGYATQPPPDTNGGLFRPVLNLNTGSPRSVSSEEHPQVQPVLHSPLHSPVNIHFEIPNTTSLNYNTSPPPARDYTDAGGSRTTSPRSINVIRRPSDVSNPRTRVTKIYLPQRADSMYSSTTANSERPVRINVLQRSNATSHASSSSQPSTRKSSVKRYPAPTPPSPRDPTKVVLSGKGLKHAHLDRPAVFGIDGRNAGPGEPGVRLTGINKEIPVRIDPTGPQQYRCTYTPTEPGAYLLDITWNKRPLKCCPFKIDVSRPVYPHKVNVSGDPLKSGYVGRDIRLQIDPRYAGSGDLTVRCVGPEMSYVPVQLLDNYDGTHSVKITPAEPGRHILNILFGGEHVLGSPYAIDIITPKKLQYPVKVYGPGIHDGVLPDFESHFLVDARGAGAGELKVVLMGPKGAFHVELSRTSQKDRLVHCRYSPVEAGLYTISVLWSNKHVDGSPFKVSLATSQLQLERMLEERRESRPSSLSSSKEVHGDPEKETILY